MSQFTKAITPKKIFMVEKGFYSINLEDGTIQKLGPEKKNYKLPSHSQNKSLNVGKDLLIAKGQQNQIATQRNNQETRKNKESTRKLNSQRNN
ncbi:unnamed protein product (macronuclear) [Paramecium tetraurelia]|uniref:Uncharacterized protein n=1 Tax=Paramecium tetraurelia TaxID=5888 RepID=A0C0F6_PARTE|nr:uncharacterized protein GSPATT00006126001 [Paramecium tetraurelia]CAK64273.1 unnamed protein product [Paramecium tetraurelia]|eukprot:XP_001431671.1 hypothetical protein (macronuclear) [Paramecium tetraurelia strain d4-2]